MTILDSHLMRPAGASGRTRARSPLETTLRAAAIAAGLFVIFSIGAACRHKLTGAMPGTLHPIAITAWGWPLGLPVAVIAAWLGRPVK